MSGSLKNIVFFQSSSLTSTYAVKKKSGIIVEARCIRTGEQAPRLFLESERAARCYD